MVAAGCPGQDREAEENPYPKPHIRLGIAWDEAFCFYYRDNLEFWKSRELRSFGSVLFMTSICRKIWMAFSLEAVIRNFMEKALEENKTMRNEIRRKAEEDMPVLAECGGYLYL